MPGHRSTRDIAAKAAHAGTDIRPAARLVMPLLALLALLVLLAGCGEGSCPCPFLHLERITAPNIRPITGLDSALLGAAQHSYFSQGYISGLAATTASAGSAGSAGNGDVLAVLDGRVYTVPLHGGQATLVPGIACGIGVALTADGSRLACIGLLQNADYSRMYGCTQYCFSPDLQLAHFTAGRQPQLTSEQTVSDAGAIFSSPTWRPDGGALAALAFVSGNSDTTPRCTLAVYGQATSSNPSLVAAMRLTIAGFSLCGTLQIAWSPNGRLLALLNSETLLVVRAPSPDAIAQAARSGQVVTGTLTPSVHIALPQPSGALTWAPSSHSLAIVSSNAGNSRDAVTQYALPLHHAQPPAPLFSLPSIGPIAYSADGHLLLFAYGVREFWLRPYLTPSVGEGAVSHPDAPRAQLPLVALRPQMCGCPQPPTALYAYLLPTASS